MTSHRLTPVMQLIINEGLFEVPTPAALTKRLSRGLLKDMLDQALFTLGSWPYEDLTKHPQTNIFRMTLGASLDPFAAQGKCTEPRCRVSMAERFARSIALYVDQAIVPDPITATLTDRNHRTVEALALALYLDLQVLRTILPLVEDGVVRFGTPIRALCAHCKEESDRRTEEGVKYTEELLIEAGLRAEIAIRRDGNGARLSLVCPKMFAAGSHELFGTYSISKKEAKRFGPYVRGDGTGLLKKNDAKQMSQYIRRYVLWLLGSVTFKMGTASASRSTFASGSRLETAFLSFLEGRRSSSGDIARWESLRSVELPWVRELSASEIVRLRHEAGPALSQLRTSFASRLHSRGGSVESLVGELQSQAVDVENELAIYRTVGGRKAKVMIGRASLAFVLYGLMTDASTAATALAATLTALATMHPSETKERIETERLKARAPYVLVHAKQLLAHRD